MVVLPFTVEVELVLVYVNEQVLGPDMVQVTLEEGTELRDVTAELVSQVLSNWAANRLQSSREEV